jgi:integrase
MLKSGIWMCEYYVKEKGKNKHKGESYGKGEAGRIAAEARDLELKSKKIRMPKKLLGPKFRELAEAYQRAKFLRAGAMSETDQINTYHKLDANILPYFGGRHAMSFNNDLLNNYISMRADHWADKAQTRKIKITTIHRELSIVKAIMNWATHTHQPPLIPYNPIERFKLPKRDDAIIIPPSAIERQKIFNAASPHMKRFIILNYNTGARSGSSELLQINWEHVDLEAGRITVVSADKGGPKLRRVPISEELAEFLVQWRNEDAEKRGLDDPALVSGPVIHFKGKPILRVNSAWRATLSRAGITRRIRPYDLRHAFATDLLEAGGDIGTVSRLMGHSRPDTTLKVYQHVTGRQEIEVLNKLPRAVRKDETEPPK